MGGCEATSPETRRRARQSPGKEPFLARDGRQLLLPLLLYVIISYSDGFVAHTFSFLFFFDLCPVPMRCLLPGGCRLLPVRIHQGEREGHPGLADRLVGRHHSYCHRTTSRRSRRTSALRSGHRRVFRSIINKWRSFYLTATFCCPLYIVDVSGVNPKETEIITPLTEKLGETSYRSPRFSCDPVQAQVLYLPRTRVGTL